MSIPTTKYDVIGAYRFLVELDGLIVGGFTEVSGLQAETELMEVAEGGVNGYVHQLPKRIKYPPLVFKRGITNSSELWDWYASASIGKITRKSGSVILHNQAGKELCRWNFFESYPVKWSGPDLNASSNGVAIETLQLVHNGLKTIFSKK